MDEPEAVQYIIDQSNEFLQELKLNLVEGMLSQLTQNNTRHVIYYGNIIDSYSHEYGVRSNYTLQAAAAILADIKAFVQVLEHSSLGEDLVLCRIIEGSSLLGNGSTDTNCLTYTTDDATLLGGT